MSELCVLKYFEDKLDLIESSLKSNLKNITLFEEKLFDVESTLLSSELDSITIESLKKHKAEYEYQINKMSKEIKKLNSESNKLFKKINKVSTFNTVAYFN